MNLALLLIFTYLPIICNAYHVLFLAAKVSKSNFLFISSFVRATLNRGHEVTFVTVHSLKHLNLTNYTEIQVEIPSSENLSVFQQDAILDWIEVPAISTINTLSKSHKDLNLGALQSEEVQKLINSTGLHFDVIVHADIYADSFLMFAYKFKAPIVAICPTTSEFIDRRHGLLSMPSYVPHYMMPYSDNMSLSSRWYNSLLVLYDWILRTLVYIPSEEEIAQTAFAQLAPLPPLKELVNNISVSLVYSHHALSPPRPSMPNIIPIGGAHIEKSHRPLPNDIQTFLDEADFCVIYFGLGSILQSSKLPTSMVQSFIETFKNIKQRVLWKYEVDPITSMPPNVMTRKWIPQNDVLAHPNVILYISHGGVYGTTESLYYGVPLLLIPFYLHQFRNAHRIQKAGYGERIDHRELNTQSFTKDIISNKSYLARAKQTSEIFKSNPMHPMDTSA